MAFGSLILKERLNCSDEELVEQIRKNPYLQYFLGLEEFSNEAPFEASMLVHFRKQISLEMIGKVNEDLVAGLRVGEIPLSDDDSPATNVSTSASKSVAEESGNTQNANNKGQLILDATFAPADITFSTGSKLINDAREKNEFLIDVLHAQSSKINVKPRTTHKIVRKKWLSFQKNDNTLKLKFVKSIARSRKIKNYTGISSSYEEPNNPDLVFDTDSETIEESVNKVIDLLEVRSIIQ